MYFYHAMLHGLYSVLMVKVAVSPTQKFLGNLCTPNIALECWPFSFKTFTNKLDAPLTTFGDSSQFSAD